MSSYYKVSHILFIYLVGRACIPGIFGWFVLLFFCLCNFFSFLKRPDHPVGGSPSPPPPTAQGTNQPVVSLQEPSWPWAPAKSLQGRELVSISQDFSGKQGSLFQGAQMTLQGLWQQHNYRRLTGLWNEWPVALVVSHELALKVDCYSQMTNYGAYIMYLALSHQITLFYSSH